MAAAAPEPQSQPSPRDESEPEPVMARSRSRRAVKGRANFEEGKGDEATRPPPSRRKPRAAVPADEADEEAEAAPVARKRAPMKRAASDASAGGAELGEAELAELRVMSRPRPEGNVVRLLTVNVNGVRAARRKGLLEYLDAQGADIVGLCEVKATEEEGLGGYAGALKHVHWSAGSVKGYAGTAVLTSEAWKPLSVQHGLGKAEHDDEGRVITLEFPGFFYVHSYVPNAGQALERLAYRTEQWDVDMLAHLKRLEASKPVIWTGDLNVAHREIDIHDPKGNQKSAGFTKEERAGFDKVLAAGFVDVFRHLHPDEHDSCYTYWSYRSNARAQNKGWRLDYFVVSPALVPRVLASWIDRRPVFSDHVPILLDLVL